MPSGFSSAAFDDSEALCIKKKHAFMVRSIELLIGEATNKSSMCGRKVESFGMGHKNGVKDKVTCHACRAALEMLNVHS